MPTAEKITLFACGVFFLTALFSGVWKWLAMRSSPDHQAPFYVDTGHRAALLYSFACLVLRAFVQQSPFPSAVNVAAVSAPILFFGIAIATYLLLGAKNETTNQFEQRTPMQDYAMISLIVAEIGGVVVLFVGFLLTNVI